MLPGILSDDNPLERETEDLMDREGNKDLHSVTKVMALSREKKLHEIQSYIQQITNDPDKYFSPQALKAELQFLKRFYKSVEENKPIEKQNENGYVYRSKTLNINVKLKKGEPVPQKDLNEICSIIRENTQLKQSFLMKMVGCTSIQRLLDISIKQIEDLTEDDKKRAIKLQIAADWKYFVKMDEQALKFKAECVRVWEKVNEATRLQTAKKEFEELKLLCKKQKIESPYVLKLLTIRKIVLMVNAIPDLPLNELTEQRKKKAALSIIFPYIIKNLELIQNEKKLENSSVATSVLRKKSIVEERRQIGKKFFEEASKNNFFYANCIAENRFSFDLFKKLILILGILDRIYKKRCRAFWQNAKN